MLTEQVERTASVNDDAARTQDRDRRGRWYLTAAFVAFVVALGLYRDYHVGYLRSLPAYDDGAYYGAATQIVSGIAPYKDFVFVQPPGAALVLTPFALLGRAFGTSIGNEAARLMMIVWASLGLVFFSWLNRSRTLLATFLGLVVFALHPSFLLSYGSILLEPILVALCLGGAVLVFDGERLQRANWRWWGAGIVFGLACTVKIWGVLPALVVVLIAIGYGQFRNALRLVGGTIGAVAVVCLPFLMMAPSAFVGQVISDQASRNDPGAVGVLSRLGNVIGLPLSFGTDHKSVLAVLYLLIVGVVIYSLVRTRHTRLTPLEWLGFGSTVLIMLSFSVSGSFFTHYPAFVAPFLGLVVCSTATRLIAPAAALQRAARTPIILLTCGVLATIALVGYQADTARKAPGNFVNYAVLMHVSTLLAREPCIGTDNESLLLLTDRFTADEPGCPRVIDTFGADEYHAHGNLRGLSSNPAVQSAWLDWFRPAGALVLQPSASAQSHVWGPRVQDYVADNFHLVFKTNGLYVYERNGSSGLS